MSTLYEKFRASFNRNGADWSIVTRARGVARRQLEDDLIANLDYFEATALGIMKSERAVGVLKEQLATRSGSVKVRIARALWDITQYPGSLAAIASVVLADAQSTSWSDRVDAACALHGIHHPEADAALGKALFDEEYLVRYNAAQTLAANHRRKMSDKKIAAAVSDGDKAKIAALAMALGAES